MNERSRTPAVPVNWDAAGTIAARLVRPGPRASRDELDELVGSLRSAGEQAAGHITEITGLAPIDGRGVSDVPLSTVLVVDRSSWARANAQVFSRLVPGTLHPQSSSPAGYVGAAQVAGVLALLSGKVLGQFDPFTSEGPRGRLFLVAPNILTVEREMAAEPADFRLWVALHEQTHALQFAAAPWLAEHLRERASRLLELTKQADDDGAPGGLGDLVERVTRVLSEALRDGGSSLDSGPALAGVLGREQAEVVKEVGAVMALLEGHADVTMDAVGPGVVPSVAAIRSRFETRRGAVGSPLQRVLRRLLGLDAKLAQYRDGAAFVRAVEKRAGTNAVNAVFSGPDALPSPREIADPRAWVRRVLG